MIPEEVRRVTPKTSEEGQRGIYCDPSTSFDGKGNFYNLAEYESIAFHFVDDQNGFTNNDEEQGFEAVLDLNHIGPSLRDYDLDDDDSEGGYMYHPNAERQLYYSEQVDQIVKDKSLNSTARRDAVFQALETLGVKTFIVVSGHEDDTSEILQRVRDVIHFFSVLKRSHSSSLKCCLLFQDTDGLLYNLTVPTQSSGPYSQWQANRNEFSGIQAMGAVSVLIRAFSFLKAERLDHAAPAFLGLILGLILSEEMSLSWMNASLSIQGVPSTSSYMLLNNDDSDWIYKGTIACLIFAGAANGNLQLVLLLLGVSLACITLLANLGSRAWTFLQWKPLSLCGPMASMFSFVIAVFAGLFFPHMSHRNIESGGKPALEGTIINAFWVGLIFIFSDYNGFQRLLVVGSELCDQHIVNIVVGAWIGLTLLLNLAMIAVRRRSCNRATEDNRCDLLLIRDQCSPVGFRVPSFPTFTIDPSHGKRSFPFLTVDYELYGSVLLAFLLLAIMVSMAFINWSKVLEQNIIELFSQISSS